jgi:hypothetical protein
MTSDLVIPAEAGTSSPCTALPESFSTLLVSPLSFPRKREPLHPAPPYQRASQLYWYLPCHSRGSGNLFTLHRPTRELLNFTGISLVIPAEAGTSSGCTAFAGNAIFPYLLTHEIITLILTVTCFSDFVPNQQTSRNPQSDGHHFKYNQSLGPADQKPNTNGTRQINRKQAMSGFGFV